MYNRYVAQADGSFQKTRVPEPHGPTAATPSIDSMGLPYHHIDTEKSGAGPSCNPMGISSFFRNLFPKGLDTEDLIVILLLLLLSQDGGKSGNRALLTLGAYLFL